ncbi:hypothetical protein L207DRAFT_585801 [Hyaloscypha variabilis F]|uniref:Uncharacterized protein n=1 Tax=Hyaloscypha variabilis (strain UAMH 11265 / GT02V1 / F) TaxID=1149755 RepID=A0A2J6RG22_HYAVF|nr:hypothetical protein L207DRAFT_585801 [Hyaloscypha variabilis F]
MRPTLGVSSTIPGISTSSSASYMLTTLLWNSKAPAEAIVQNDLNPYYGSDRWYTDRPSDGLSAKCGRAWETSFYQWVSTAVESSTLLEKFSCFNHAPAPGALVRQCWNTSTEWTMLQTFQAEAQSFPFTASPPCCGGCSFTAGDVQVYHWPPATTSPLVSMLVNSEGFTFTYPSVYVVFQSIVASNLCELVGSAIPSITTMAFDISELSTGASYTAPPASSWGMQMPPAWYITQSATWWSYSQMDLRTSVICTDITTTVWTSVDGNIDGAPPSPPGPYTISWTSLLSTRTWTWSQMSTEIKIPLSDHSNYSGLPASDFRTFTQFASSKTETFTELASSGTVTVFPSFIPWTLTYNPCEPYLSIPSRILKLDPLWKACSQGVTGLHDPPVMLEPSNGLFPVTTTAPGGPSGFLSVPTRAPGSFAEETRGASAGQAIPQPVVTKTPSPNISKLPAVATIGTTIVTANLATIFVIGTQTLAPGQKITESGTLLSMASDGRELVIGSSTQVLDPAYVIGTQTLSAGGPAATFDETVMSLISGSGTDGESVLIGGASGETWTEDASMLAGTGLGTARTGWATASVGGEGAGARGSGSTSGSAKMKVGALIVWQIVLFCFAKFYVG